ncbi:metal-dependent transcriptional regulator [Arachnia rubra]|jgi:iron dependent repressor|uniref:Metal-dependent transcriptional regulator n=1 Tax=Arachnia rubra TaxID=1547448 RepID=A0ABX7Y2U1_9ACTN|nr:metal-dependent transcriptional regulator [Arachnia rubra]MBB1572441.1 metal-dependent transcriptional regulator [Propionibacterium sp.]MDO4646632.1 metal-dependent transcriptional regulator [Propionibacteriaceae bacterium]MBB1576903.1 metal-dependent transcriptional regulator [Propionibacterium sp.]QUC07479.1 metal-dependent transcriptional regulator [Arachnia rubra]BCR81774.1 DtxR family transcriptional regulator [Arachnia rubra]
MSELIDTTEMYLRTVYELLEEGVPPLRARIAERLHQSGPTVSQTVARMERDGLLAVKADRTIKLTPKGARLARDVMRKHRLAERLLTDVIGLEWEKVHEEACRWEHVISDDVERRLLGILESPTRSPYGNPIPGLKDLGMDYDQVPFREGVVPLSQVVPNRGEVTVTLQRMSENLQADAEVLSALAALGLRPGMDFVVRRVGLDLRFSVGEEAVTVDEAVAELLFVSAP